jgi:hypothetical protein
MPHARGPGRFQQPRVLLHVSEGVSGVRPAAFRMDVPATTARDWVRRFAGRAAVLFSGFPGSATSRPAAWINVGPLTHRNPGHHRHHDSPTAEIATMGLPGGRPGLPPRAVRQQAHLAALRTSRGPIQCDRRRRRATRPSRSGALVGSSSRSLRSRM